jgi:hypothetical protein
MLNQRLRDVMPCPLRETSGTRSKCMTAVSDNREQVEAGTAFSTRARMAGIGTWLADQWPKAAIVFGIALTIAWVALLAWGLSLFLYLF